MKGWRYCSPQLESGIPAGWLSDAPHQAGDGFPFHSAGGCHREEGGGSL